MDETTPKFVTIEYFINDMLGYKSRTTYYNHLDDANWPQRVYPGGGKPMLVYDECVAFVRRRLAERAPPPPFKKRKAPPLPDGTRRRAGRPRKVA